MGELDYRGGMFRLPDNGGVIETGTPVVLDDGSRGVVVDREEGNFVFRYEVEVDGVRMWVATNELEPVENSDERRIDG